MTRLLLLWLLLLPATALAGGLQDQISKTYIDPNITGYPTANLPANATRGQLAFDTTTNQLKVYNGSAWVASSGGGASTSDHFVTTTSDGDVANATNLGALSTGYIKCTVSGGICTVSSDNSVVSTGSTNTYAAGMKQTFTPNATNAGVNVGSTTAAPSVPVNGDIYYDSVLLKFQCRENGVWVNCIGSGGLTTHNLLSSTHTDTVTATPNLGDMLAGNVSNLWAVLAGSTSATDKCLHQIGTGSASALPTWSGCGPVNAQTGTTYTVVASDNTKLVTHSNASATVQTIPQAGTAGFAAGFMYFVENRGAGTVTLTPTTSTIDGSATLALTQNQGVCVFSDGTNYFTGCRGTGGAGGTDTYALNFQSGGASSSSGAMAQNTTYFLVQDGVFSGSGLAGGVTVPKTGTLTAVYWRAYIQGATGTAGQLVTHKVRKNNTTDTTGCTTDYSAAQNTCNEPAISFAVTAGDYLEFKVVTPVTWTSAAGSVRWTIAMVLQ